MLKWRDLTKGQFEQLARQSIQSLAYRVQANTAPPVGPNVITGFLMGSWQPSIGSVPPIKADLAPDRNTDAELAVIVSTMRIGQVFYYTNNAAYALRQEYGFTGVDSLGRAVHQQGKFFVKKTIAQWPHIVDETAADLNFRM